MPGQFNIKRRKSDFGGRYQPITGNSTHPEDIDYIRRNIPCQWNCPAYTDIPAYIKAIFNNDFASSYTINRKANLFPGVLGRVCSRPCESHCRHGEADLGEPVGICFLKRAAADSCHNDYHLSEKMFAPTGKSVAIVGGGPAGLAAAHTLALFGHRVSIIEAKQKLGGMLLYGIPDFRVPPELVEKEIYNILRAGVQVSTGVRLGLDISLAELRGTHDAVVIALGCYHENRLQIPGDNLTHVYSGLDFMMRMNEGTPYPVGKRVAVIGGGFTAMDCSRSALRLGATQVINYIRRTEEEFVVTKEEVLEAKKEGVKICALVSPIKILGNETVEGIQFIRNRLVAGNGGFGKRPMPIEDSEFSHEADTVIVAIGQGPDLTPVWGQEPIAHNERGESGEPGLFLAGDCCQGASTVIEAIGHAQKVASACDTFLMGKQRSQWTVTCSAASDTSRKRTWDFIPPTPMPTLALPARLASATAEVETGFSQEQTGSEASRCYLCNLRYTIHVQECIYCRWCIDRCPRNCIHLSSDMGGDGGPPDLIRKTSKWNETAAIIIDSERCIRCGECLRICPTQCIHVTEIGFKNLFNGALAPTQTP